MAEPLFTRLLLPKSPPAPPAPPATVPAVSPAPKASRKTTTARTVTAPVAQAASSESTTAASTSTPSQPPTAMAEPEVVEVAKAAPNFSQNSGESAGTETAIAPAPDAALPTQPKAIADIATAIATANANANAYANAEPDPLQSWPLDTRLSFRLGGFYRGDLHGSARVQWQRDKSSYQVTLTVSAAGLTLATLTSQGEATGSGLMPRVYEEQLPGGLRRADFSNGIVRFQNGNSALLPTGAQDTVSQFVDLAHRFATGRETLAAGGQVRVWLGRPGGLDEWIYDVGEVEILETPQLGRIPAYHLTPRPLANLRGAITAELWFAPSLQYLPVRVRITLGDGNFVDLMIERIEQVDVVRR